MRSRRLGVDPYRGEGFPTLEWRPTMSQEAMPHKDIDEAKEAIKQRMREFYEQHKEGSLSQGAGAHEQHWGHALTIVDTLMAAMGIFGEFVSGLPSETEPSPVEPQTYVVAERRSEDLLSEAEEDPALVAERPRQVGDKPGLDLFLKLLDDGIRWDGSAGQREQPWSTGDSGITGKWLPTAEHHQSLGDPAPSIRAPKGRWSTRVVPLQHGIGGLKQLFDGSLGDLSKMLQERATKEQLRSWQEQLKQLEKGFEVEQDEKKRNTLESDDERVAKVYMHLLKLLGEVRGHGV
jgi:hypothetical protein